MGIGAPKELSTLRRFFLEPRLPKHRQYEALRAYLVEGRLAKDVARAFGYTLNSFHVLCHHFRRETHPAFFLSPRHGPQSQPKKSAARDLIVKLRKQNHSVYEISQILKDRHSPLSPTGVREVLRAEGFAPLPRRLDEERPRQPRPTVEPIANVRLFSLAPRTFTTRCGGLFLFVADLVRLQTQKLTQAAGLPGSKMIPADHALRCCLALKLWSIERKSHVMALIADEGLALFAGLNAFPKKSYLSEYSCRIDPRKTDRFLTAWHHCILGTKLLTGESFNLDFHSVPFYGEDPMVERHYVSGRSRSQPSMLVFLAQNASSHVFCYSNADLRKGEEAEEIFQFIDFWKRAHGKLPSHLVFDSKLTTHAGRFFHIDALSSAVGMKVDFDMALLVLASGLYRLIAQRMHGYADAQARQIFRDLIDMPADVTVSDKEVEVSFHRRAHLPILLASDLMEKRIAVPWWNGLPLRLTTYDGRQNTPPT